MISVLILDPSSLTLHFDATHITQRPQGEVLLQTFEHAYRGNIDDLKDLLNSLRDTDLQARCANFASCVWHEKRHYLDFILTNYGSFRIRQYFQLYANLDLLLSEASQANRDIWFPLDVYADPVTRYSCNITENWPTAEAIGANMRRLRDSVAEDRQVIGDGENLFEFGGDAQFEGLAWISQVTALQELLGAEFSRIAQRDMSLFSVNKQRYRWSEYFAAGLGILPVTQLGQDYFHNVSMLIPLLFAALQIRAYGQIKSTPKSELSSLPLNRLFALSERIRKHPKQFLSSSIEDAWNKVNEFCFDIWGRTAIEEMQFDFQFEEAFVQEVIANEVVSETVKTCLSEFHSLRGKLLKLMIEEPTLILDPALFASGLLPSLRPLTIWCRADGIKGRPSEGFRLIHGYYDNPQDLGAGWWWASLREYEIAQDSLAVGFDRAYEWGGLTSHFSPTAKLMMNGRAHRTMIGPEIFSAEQRLRAAGLTINLDSARAFPREDPVLQMHAYYLLHASQTAVCDLCRKQIKKPEGRLLPPWLFRHNIDMGELATAALSPTREATDASRRRFWQDWSPWVSCDSCFQTMLQYEAFKVAFEATCL